MPKGNRLTYRKSAQWLPTKACLIMTGLLFLFHATDQYKQVGESIAGKIPRKIFSSYEPKSSVPQKVYDTISQFAKGYKYTLFDDHDCVQFLMENYNDTVVRAYKSLRKGAHRADLFRYAVLYLKGGIWMDVDLKLMTNLDELLGQRNVMYTVANDVLIFQAFLAAPPQNPIIFRLLRHAISQAKQTRGMSYEVFLRQIFEEISIDVGHLGPFNGGFYKSINYHTDYILFKEICVDTDKQRCPEKMSKKWKSCCYVYHGEKRIFRSRYYDYPWKYIME